MSKSHDNWPVVIVNEFRCLQCFMGNRWKEIMFSVEENHLIM